MRAANWIAIKSHRMLVKNQAGRAGLRGPPTSRAPYPSFVELCQGDHAAPRGNVSRLNAETTPSPTRSLLPPNGVRWTISRSSRLANPDDAGGVARRLPEHGALARPASTPGGSAVDTRCATRRVRPSPLALSGALHTESDVDNPLVPFCGRPKRKARPSIMLRSNGLDRPISASVARCSVNGCAQSGTSKPFATSRFAISRSVVANWRACHA